MKLGRIFVAAMSVALISGSALGDDPVKREGTGARRATLDAMELKAAPANLFSTLTDWTNGEALTPAAMKDKVIVIGTWSSFYQTSHEALTVLQKMNDTYGKDGVIIVGVHHDKGWDNAKSIMDAKNVKFLVAHDAGNTLRKTLDVDQDPDFYIIDRAGNLRYADIVTSSVEVGVQSLVKETTAEAAAAPAKKAEFAAKATEEANRTKPITNELKPGEVINVPFAAPDADAYKSAAWPEKNTSVQYATDVQGSALPAALGNEKWISKQPVTAGRVLVLDFWATWCGPCKAAMPKLDELYKSNKANLNILGISDENFSKVEGFLQANKHAYFQAVDEKKTIYGALNITAIPHCVVISSDGIVRWQGNPHDENFKKAVMTCISVDPGVKARQKAEAEYLKKTGG